MENHPNHPTKVLLVGSIPLETSTEVFTQIPSALPNNRLYSLPDGEPGNRNNYIGWQLSCFPTETRQFFLGGTSPSPSSLPPTYTLADIKPTQYDDVAISSYSLFSSLKNEGKVPKDIRFQVCLPTPFNSIQGHVRPEFHAQLEPLYETRIIESVSRIVDSIPHSDLVIQWDVCFEMIALEYANGRVSDPRYKAHFQSSGVQQGVVDRVVRVCQAVPKSVPMAFHLCYGDLRHRHFVEPESMGTMVELANSITSALSDTHTVKWIHMPVPKDRKDAAYFSPLRGLRLGE
ncbi:MAG: hypothetical protein Q9222_007559, partial [Ikaeria aurantiellina]